MARFSYVFVVMALFFLVSCDKAQPVVVDDGNGNDELIGDEDNAVQTESETPLVTDDALASDDTPIVGEDDVVPTEGEDQPVDDNTVIPDESDNDSDEILVGDEDNLPTDETTDELTDETADETGDETTEEVADDFTPPVDEDVQIWENMDEDGDSILNGIEGMGDVDGDGTPNYLDPDSDGDGILDMYEGDTDFDADGMPNFVDTDSDNDGFLDATEVGIDPNAPLDSDTDGYFDFVDTDSDSDGLTDAKEFELGSDQTKADSDGDTFDDSTEFAYWSAVEPANVGANIMDPSKVLPSDIFYFILPYQDPEKQAPNPLLFSTNIKIADVMILVDLSGSMAGEHSNLKSGINNTIINGVKAAIPDSAFGLAKFGTLEDTPYVLAQGITTNTAAVQTAVNGITDVGGSSEAAYEALYQTVTGEGLSYSGGCGGSDIEIPAYNPGWRQGSLPIVIMCTDEELQSYDGTHSPAQVYAAMNTRNTKFIGIDSGGDVAMTQYEAISDNTGSVDGSGNGFNYEINSDGSGLSQQVVDAVIALTSNIKVNLTTTRDSVSNPQSVDTSLFITAVIPNYSAPANAYDSKDTTTFYGVKPGTEVYFDVKAINTIYEPTTTESTLFKALIHVYGAGTLLDTREVYIIVPGKKDCGSGGEGGC